MKVRFLIIMVLGFMEMSAQNYFVKEIDLENHSYDLFKNIFKYENKYVTISSSLCNNNTKECTLIANLNSNGKLLNTKNLSWLDINEQNCVLDKDTLIIVGTEYMSNRDSLYFYKQTIQGDSILNKWWKDPTGRLTLIDVEGFKKYKNQFVVVGSALDRNKLINNEKYQIAFIAYLDLNGIIDTVLYFKNHMNDKMLDVHIDSDSLLTVFWEWIDLTMPSDKQSYNGILKINEKKEIVWDWNSEGFLSLVDPGLLLCKKDSSMEYQGRKKRKGVGFSQSIQSISKDKKLGWINYKPWSTQNRNISLLKESENNQTFVLGNFNEISINPTAYFSKLDNLGKTIVEKKYIKYNDRNDKNQTTWQGLSFLQDIIEEKNGDIILSGSVLKNTYDSILQIYMKEYDLLLIKVDSFGCVNQDKCNDYFAWGDIPDSLYQYDQINTNNKIWNYEITNNKGTKINRKVFFGQDSVIFDQLWGDRQYKEVIYQENSKINLDTLFVRWDNKGQLFYIDKWTPKDGMHSPSDSLLYDFTLKIGDKFLLPHNYGMATVKQVDSIELHDGFNRKRIILNHDNKKNQEKFGDLIWIEGIGSLSGLFYFNDWDKNQKTKISCYVDRNIIRYGSGEYCKYTPTKIDSSEYKIGDTWTYSDYSSIGCIDRKIFTSSIIEDTLINNKLYSVLATFENSKKIENSEVYLYKKNSKIYFYDNEEDYLLYDFTAKIGDTIKYFIPSNGYLYKPYSYYEKLQKPLEQVLRIIKIDSIKTNENITLKSYTTDLLSPYIHNKCSTLTKIIENIGGISGIFGYPCSSITEGCFGELRCFQSTDINLNLIIGDCISNKVDSSIYKIGDRWLYSPYSLNCEEIIYKIEVLRDTLIKNRLCNIFNISSNENPNSQNEMVIFYRDSIVEFYENKAFKVIYNFKDKLIGDTVKYYLPLLANKYNISSLNQNYSIDTNGYNYVVKNILSIVNDENVVLKKYQIENIESNKCEKIGEEIIVGIGSISGFFGQEVCDKPNLNCKEYFRCFKSKNNNYNALDRDCQLTSNKEIEGIIFRIMPNPNQGILKIESNKKISEINIYDLKGKTIKSIRSGVSEFNIIDLPSGLYILEAKDDNKNLARNLFVKNN